ncbi:MAG: sugar phosphate isomerase/epimerase [Candidatus Hydrogenedentes bacterium]|nr:sugar phosphate isomerase/epimerase [Candidatus Hydrogenedentota bacterium]
MSKSINRRRFLQTASSAGALAAATLGASQSALAAPAKKFQKGISPFPLCLNTSTIRPASLKDKIKVAADAGYDAIELWMNDLEEYEKAGGNVKDLGKEIKDRGLFVPDCIGLWDDMPPTEEEFKASLPATRNRMRLAADAGSQHVAALPLHRDLLNMGRKDFNIICAMEFVSLFNTIPRLGQACAIAIDANDKDACIVADTFHLHNGGSGFEGIRHLNGSLIAVFHWSDVGPEPAPGNMHDGDRIYPGDGILPLKSAIQQLAEINYTGCLSLELFNAKHYEIAKTDPLQIAKTGLEKMRACVQSALG